MDRPAGIDGSFWRAITVFRIASLRYAALLLAGADGHQRPIAGWLVFAVMVAWTAVAALAYPGSAGWPLLAADLLVTAGCVLAAPYAQAAAGTLPNATARIRQKHLVLDLPPNKWVPVADLRRLSTRLARSMRARARRRCRAT